MRRLMVTTVPLARTASGHPCYLTMASYEEVGPPGSSVQPVVGAPSGRPSADRRLALTGLAGHLPASFLPVRQRPFRPNEVTGVAVGIFLQIVLMLRLGLPERSDR